MSLKLEMSGIEQNQKVDDSFAEAKKELEVWKVKVEKADDTKDRLIMKKLEQDQEKKKTKDLMMALIKKHDQTQAEFNRNLKFVQDQIQQIVKRKKDLMDKLKRCRAQLEAKKTESSKLQQKFKICAQIPDKDVEFIKENDGDKTSGDEPIQAQFSVCQQGALLLRGGQALITFEEENVVSRILTMDRCSVSFEDEALEVKPKRIRTEPVVQFEVLLNVSRTQLTVCDVLSSMPKERVADRLELAFSKPSRGGAEVDSVEYDEKTGTGRVTFLSPGAAEALSLRGEHTVDLDFKVNVKVGPVYEHQLQRFQSFCGAPKRTLLLDDIRDTGDEDEVQDQLEIHFQKPSNGGGEIEATKYICSGKSLLAFFSKDH